ncbi:MAG: hypothetical protein GWP06_00400 [Actinobacteria bacterium]|nr:hypothetical protein [Actinomycetota bacterium]
MKKLIIQILAIIILLLTVNSCSDAQKAADDCLDSSSDCNVEIVVNDPETPEDEPIIEDTPEVITDSTTDIEIDEEEIEIVIKSPDLEPISLTFLTTDTLYFYDGQFIEQPNVNPVNCGAKCFTDSDQRIIYDESGEIVSQETLIVEPSFILGDWIIENIDPDTAFSLGGQRKDYSRIYFQGVEQGNWFLNQWKATDLIQTISGDIIVIEGNNFHPLTAVTGINHAKNLLIHDFDSVNRTAIIETNGVYAVSWATNYFNGAKDWLFLNGIYYSWNGYELEADLTENANALWGWNTTPYLVEIPNGQNPTLLSAGVFENALYWIECNTGWLTRYVPESDVLETVSRLYVGDGYRTTGLLYLDSLKPVIVQGKLYFYDGSIWEFDLRSGIVNLFFGGSGEVAEW